ncbi:hypothetical protein CTZ27_31770 [Streptomyces griseocarneus]|nr:hypothetical protein CTZ27_31770 [Streptomyces griseocarneus]
MNIVLVAAIAVGGMGMTAAVAQAAPVSRTAVLVPGGQPPFPYEDCLDAARQHKESPDHAKWHCDELVKKGWVKPPAPGAQSKKPSSQPKQSKPGKPQSKPGKPSKPQSTPAKGKGVSQPMKKTGSRPKQAAGGS